MAFKNNKLYVVVAAVFFIVGFILLFCGVAVYHSRPACEESEQEDKPSVFDKFLQKVNRKYYELQPYKILELELSPKIFLKMFKPYDPNPQTIKKITDESLSLVKELDNLGINVDKLNKRERKAFAQVKHFCKHIFGQPFDVNYYAGDWLMGPNYFCWQPICYITTDIYNSLVYLQPLSYDDIPAIKKNLKMFKKTLEQYTENIRAGWEAGMIRSVEDCISGTNSFKQDHYNISYHNETGVLLEWYTKPVHDPEYFAHLYNRTAGWKKWKKTHGEFVNETVMSYLVEYIGKPVNKFIRFLETENMRHCVPSSVVSGLGSLPVDYVYIDGVRTNKRTTKRLPTGEPISGKESYKKLLSYFTTNEMTPQEIFDLGHQQLAILYPQVLEIARRYTKKDNNSTAKGLFQAVLNSSDMFFADNLPEIESNATAHRLCADEKGAKEHCPKRWKAMLHWFDMARQVMSMMDSKINKFFHFTGDKVTTPNCPIKMLADFNPSSGAQSYLRSTPDCRRTSYYNIPFFMEKPGPIYEEWSVNAHEARPGHHTQVQGLVEHFRDTGGGVIGWLDSKTRYTSFTEGWALYAENPLIAQETDVYADDSTLLYKYGMLKWQVWRALRLIVDTGLHYKGFKRDWALQMFADYAWDNGDQARKEVTRYQSDPGQATAYMIGQLHILKLRKRSEEKLGENFSIKDFHYQLLSQGSSPLSYLESHVNKWLSCLDDSSQESCEDIFKADTGSRQTEGRKYNIKFGAEFPLPAKPHPHYV